MNDLARQDAIEKALRIIAVVVAVVMLLTFTSIALTGLLSLATTISAGLLFLSSVALFVVDMVL